MVHSDAGSISCKTSQLTLYLIFRYELMSSCWKENPLMRPAFSQIAQQLKNFLREVKVINGCIQKLSISSLPFAFLKIISALFFLLPFIHYASLYPSMDPSVTLSVLLINLLSPTAAIHSSIRKHSHPSICFSVYLNELNYRSFLRLLVIRFILCLDLILIQYNRYFYPYSYFFVTNLFRGHIQISQGSTMGKLDDTLTLKQTPHFI